SAKPGRAQCRCPRGASRMTSGRSPARRFAKFLLAANGLNDHNARGNTPRRRHTLGFGGRRTPAVELATAVLMSGENHPCHPLIQLVRIDSRRLGSSGDAVVLGFANLNVVV